MLHFLITEEIESSSSMDGHSLWTSYKTENGSKVIFWGSPGEGLRNINELKKHPLPILVELEDPELCHTHSKYDCAYSVSEDCCISARSAASEPFE